MKMRDGLTSVGTIVDHNPETRIELELACELTRDQEAVAEDGLVVREGFADPGDRFAGYNQNMHRGLRVNVANGDALFVLVLESCGNVPCNDFFE